MFERGSHRRGVGQDVARITMGAQGEDMGMLEEQQVVVIGPDGQRVL
jgi:hypothetical protein